jgi:hypothetical protein
MLKCYGGKCPIKEDCYRFTQPYIKRNAFAEAPYNHETNTCEYFYSNIPEEEMIRITAYYVWLRNGMPQNKDLEHWYEAYHSLCLSTGRIKPEL